MNLNVNSNEQTYFWAALFPSIAGGFLCVIFSPGKTLGKCVYLILELQRICIHSYYTEIRLLRSGYLSSIIVQCTIELNYFENKSLIYMLCNKEFWTRFKITFKRKKTPPQFIIHHFKGNLPYNIIGVFALRRLDGLVVVIIRLK